MRNTRAVWCLSLLVGCLLFAGCLSVSGPQAEAESLITPLPKLTTALQALVRWPDAGTPQTSAGLLAKVYKDKPELRRAFAGVKVKVWHDTRQVVVLVCSPDGRQAWLEDASWTPQVDCKWYEKTPARAPVFSLVPPP